MEFIDALTTLHLAKVQENIAKEKRLDAERKVLEFFMHKEEGSETRKVGNLKVTVTHKLDRKLDFEAYQQIASCLPVAMECVRMVPDLDLRKLRILEAADPTLAASFITTKPAKPSIKLEVIE